MYPFQAESQIRGERVVDAKAGDAGEMHLHEDWRIVESMLPAGWQAKARELGALQRARGVADARTLLRVMLIHLAEGCGLRETAVRAGLAGLAQVSDVALLKRLRTCGPWFEWLAQGLREAPELTPMPLSGFLRGHRLRVVDGSMVSEPGPTGSKWRLHYAIGLPDLHCQEVLLSPSADGETLRRFEVRPGDVFIADRAYANPAGIAHVIRNGGDVLVRMNLVTLPLYASDFDPQAQPVGETEPWDVLKHARKLEVGQTQSWPVKVWLKGKAREPSQLISGRLCALRKSEVAAEQGRQRVLRESQRCGSATQPQTLEAAGFVFVFTTLASHIDAEQVLQTYRLRWQIELEFKRLKSLIQLGHLKKHDDKAARSWLQGKLLVSLLVARLIAHAERVSPWGYNIQQVMRAS
jgi:hypothetical protein